MYMQEILLLFLPLWWFLAMSKVNCFWAEHPNIHYWQLDRATISHSRRQRQPVFDNCFSDYWLTTNQWSSRIFWILILCFSDFQFRTEFLAGCCCSCCCLGLSRTCGRRSRMRTVPLKRRSSSMTQKVISELCLYLTCQLGQLSELEPPFFSFQPTMSGEEEEVFVFGF